MYTVLIKDKETMETQVTNKFDTLRRANRWKMNEEVRLGEENYFFLIVNEEEN
jgi:hypothetical protein